MHIDRIPNHEPVGYDHEKRPLDVNPIVEMKAKFDWHSALARPGVYLDRGGTEMAILQNARCSDGFRGINVC